MKLRILVKDKSTGRYKSMLTDKELPVARIIHTLPCMDGNPQKIYNPEITSWQQKRQCAWCGAVFLPKYVAQKMQRFCGRSCSAKWRMADPARCAKVHTEEIKKRRGISKAAWFKRGSPTAIKEIERLRNLNPMQYPEVRKKVSDTLQAMNHKPSVQGGNGKPMPIPQQIMLDALGAGWYPEYAVPMGSRGKGYPTNYKIDIANPHLMIGIEADGASHYSRKELDKKKDTKLNSLGWTILRFWNKDILNWKNTGMHPETYISMTLKQHNIHLSV